MGKLKVAMVLVLLMCNVAEALPQEKVLNLNRPGREAWFSSLGFGMFIHWSMDVQLGTVISHSMVGASDDYLERYITELPKTFNPQEFDAESWAKAAKKAGMKYVVFTAKHHNGFCMYDTKTTDFSIMNTPYGKDVTKVVVDAFRKEGLAVGIYFSPEDFYFLHQQGNTISRTLPTAKAAHNEPLNDYVKDQMRELMTSYGDIDIVFLDALDQYAKTEIAKVCWEVNPEVVVTRGAIPTPEQTTPDSPMASCWEACYTLGDQWQYRPTNERYKTAEQTIEKLIEIRSKGGNFLLNFAPDAAGNLPPDQAAVLNELSLWMFINDEAFRNTIPLKTIREGDIWFLKKKDQSTIYAFLTEDNWELGDRRTYILNSFKATPETKVSVLGQNSEILEYRPKVDVSSSYKEIEDGLEISVVRAQRIYNDRKWPNPIVVKLENIAIR
ncbi:alpha-L-fucosidase [Echinicola soli]|uniref:alpha-L-fucosidase n=1 Tax=Echinicola soli TaxID=2591634 RepID=A0A514CGH5_9BACT|nr:alpha-L-fucosidase [Echinicola soli]QDH78870.1 alpha-L-fucosidase [Echinicola soli]